MGQTINDGFDKLHTWLTPYETESEAVRSHRNSIQACLESNFGMTKMFRTGSTGNATGISGYSDTDYFAVIPSNQLSSNSATSLATLRAVLETRFSSTNIYVDSPAVVCPFGTFKAESTEIVPAIFFKTENAYDIYNIPDGSGGWMPASPLAHNSYVTSVNIQLSGKVKKIIRFIKAWKYYNNVPISSFYLEIMITKYAAKESAIIYSIDIKRIIKQLVDNGLSAIIDPTGISGYIYPCPTPNKKAEALSKLNTALGRCNKARQAEMDDDVSTAFYWWNMFFNDKFPAYS